MDGEPVELVNVRLVATVPVERPDLHRADRRRPTAYAAAGERRATSTAPGSTGGVLDRAGDGRGFEAKGPASVEFAEATCVVRPGWSGAVDAAGTLVLTRRALMTPRPLTLSVLASALAGIAEEMGAVLVRGAYSSNIKERRDCSAALFDAAAGWSPRPSTSPSTSARCPRRWRR